jgi:XTP/dITP diphosphohydrolase
VPDSNDTAGPNETPGPDAGPAGPDRPGSQLPDLPGSRLLALVAIMDKLRTTCPWDQEQTHASLARYLLEEAYEAVDAIAAEDLPALREEIGDVLLQVLFHARIAAERPAADGGFTIDDVADTLAAKLIRRHPHVFGTATVTSAADVNANWEDIKKAERAAKAAAGGAAPPSVLDGVPFGQSALSLAAQIQRRAARAGMRFDDDDDDSADLGDQLMRLVAQAGEAGLDPELELRATARRLAERIREAERSGSALLLAEHLGAGEQGSDAGTQIRGDGGHVGLIHVGYRVFHAVRKHSDPRYAAGGG